MQVSCNSCANTNRSWIRTRGAIGLTGCAQRTGVSTVAKHLAIHAAGVLDRPVLLVDANINHPSMQETFGTNGSPGVVEALSDQAFPLECVQPSSIENLSLLTIGSTNEWNWSAFESEPLSNFLNAIHDEFGFIVFDLPSGP